MYILFNIYNIYKLSQPRFLLFLFAIFKGGIYVFKNQFERPIV